MITGYYKEKGKILKTGGSDAFEGIELKDVIWIDLNSSNAAEKDYVEKFTGQNLQA
jgi:hypothetical protein